MTFIEFVLPVTLPPFTVLLAPSTELLVDMPNDVTLFAAPVPATATPGASMVGAPVITILSAVTVAPEVVSTFTIVRTLPVPPT